MCWQHFGNISLVTLGRRYLLNGATHGFPSRTVLARAGDPRGCAFWEHEFAALHATFQAEAIAPIQNKVGAYVSSPFLRNILGQSDGTLDLHRLMDEA